MPLTDKGREILHKMEEEYGSKKGESVFYASANKGNIAGVHDAMEQSKLDAVMGMCQAYDAKDATKMTKGQFNRIYDELVLKFNQAEWALKQERAVAKEPRNSPQIQKQAAEKCRKLELETKAIAKQIQDHVAKNGEAYGKISWTGDSEAKLDAVMAACDAYEQKDASDAEYYARHKRKAEKVLQRLSDEGVTKEEATRKILRGYDIERRNYNVADVYEQSLKIVNNYDWSPISKDKKKKRTSVGWQDKGVAYD